MEEEAIKLLKSVNGLVEFSTQQAPEMARQILAYEIVTSITWLLVCVGIMYAASQIKKQRDEILGLYKESIDGSLLKEVILSKASKYTFYIIVMAAISTLGISLQVDDILKVLISPNVYILEYSKALLHTCG